MKILLIAFFLFSILDARENPFFPSDGEKPIPYTSNENRTIPPLKQASITLPPQARVLQSVTVQYKNLDGSQETQSIQMENSVDWHTPIFISQNSTIADKAEQDFKKIEPIKIEQESKTKGEKCVEETLSSEKEKVDLDEKYKQLTSVDYASFHLLGKYLKIVTKDAMIRHFMLVQPHRIVIDFKKDKNIKVFEQKISESSFTKIRVGNHDGYYRVVIELDGFYKYKMKDTESGYIFELL